MNLQTLIGQTPDELDPAFPPLMYLDAQELIDAALGQRKANPLAFALADRLDAALVEIARLTAQASAA